MYSIENFDKEKSKIMKYIIYKKRTEYEVRNKFKQTIEPELLDDIIEYIKEAGYLNDENYIAKSVNEFIALKNLSIKEIKYKLMTKGLKTNLIEQYVDNNLEELLEYEKQSARNLAIKKSNTSTIEEIKLYLINKGYKKSSIEYGIDEI